MDSSTKDVNRKRTVVRYALIAVGEVASWKGYIAVDCSCQFPEAFEDEFTYNCLFHYAIFIVGIAVVPPHELRNSRLLNGFFEHWR